MKVCNGESIGPGGRRPGLKATVCCQQGRALGKIFGFNFSAFGFIFSFWKMNLVVSLHRSGGMDVTRSLSPAGKCTEAQHICWGRWGTGLTAGFPYAVWWLPGELLQGFKEAIAVMHYKERKSGLLSGL